MITTIKQMQDKNNPYLSQRLNRFHSDLIPLIEVNSKLKELFNELPEQLKPEFLKLINEDLKNNYQKAHYNNNAITSTNIEEATKNSICFKLPPLKDKIQEFIFLATELELDWKPLLKIEVTIPNRISLFFYTGVSSLFRSRNQTITSVNQSNNYLKHLTIDWELIKGSNLKHDKQLVIDFLKDIILLFDRELLFKCNIELLFHMNPTLLNNVKKIVPPEEGYYEEIEFISNSMLEVFKKGIYNNLSSIESSLSWKHYAYQLNKILNLITNNLPEFLKDWDF